MNGIDSYGAEYKRTPNDFRFRRLEQDNCICSICHGTGAVIEFEYVTRDYASARRKGKICKNLQAHGHRVWICQYCIDNLVNKSKGLVKIFSQGGRVMTNEELKKINIKQAADLFLSNDCGRCDDCELAKKYIEIGGSFITPCHLMYSVLREDRKREDVKK